MKVHVSRSVNQIQYILLSPILVLHLDGMALDRNTSLLFQVHIVKHLPFGYLDGFVNSNKRSAKVDFPWSICAIMQKLRIFFIFNSYLFKNKFLAFRAQRYVKEQDFKDYNKFIADNSLLKDCMPFWIFSNCCLRGLCTPAA